MRDTHLFDESLDRAIKRKGFFIRILEALHASRRREMQRVLRRHRHLVAPSFRDRPDMIASECGPSQQKEAHANRNQNFLRIVRRALEDA